MEEEIRVPLPRKGTILGIIDAALGSSRLRVRCQDDKVRICRIPGRFRRRMWVREGDVVMVKPWEIQGDSHGDIVLRYSPTQAGWLKRKGILKVK